MLLKCQGTYEYDWMGTRVHFTFLLSSLPLYDYIYICMMVRWLSFGAGSLSRCLYDQACYDLTLMLLPAKLALHMSIYAIPC